MLKKYQNLPPFFHYLISLIIVIVLMTFLFNPNILGEGQLYICVPLVILIILEIVIGNPMKKKKAPFEADANIVYQITDIKEIKEKLIKDKFIYNCFNDDDIYFKNINSLLVEIEFRNNFDNTKYVAEKENLITSQPKTNKKLSIVIVLSNSRKAKLFARYFGYVDDKEVNVALTYNNAELTQTTTVLGNNESLLNVLRKYFFRSN